MPPKQPYARIAITLPAADLAAINRAAREQDRSRSWVIAEAIRRYVAPAPAIPGLRPASLPGLGASRLAQLKADLLLTPEARVLAATATARTVPRGRRAPARQSIAFDRYEDFLDWKQLRATTG